MVHPDHSFPDDAENKTNKRQGLLLHILEWGLMSSSLS